LYKYEFVRLETTFFSKYPQDKYQGIINSYAEKGWRFKQIFAPVTSGGGRAPYFELIFEKEV